MSDTRTVAILDGQAYTLDEIEAILDDPATDLTKVVEVDGDYLTLADLKTVVEIERYLDQRRFSFIIDFLAHAPGRYVCARKGSRPDFQDLSFHGCASIARP